MFHTNGEKVYLGILYFTKKICHIRISTVMLSLPEDIIITVKPKVCYVFFKSSMHFALSLTNI